MIVTLAGLLGLILGSFVNALVWRIHQQDLSGSDVPKGLKGGRPIIRGELSIVHGRSMCPVCHHNLGMLDLIPVFSWLWLRGKCRYCHTPISWQYPLVELLTAALFVMSCIWWPLGFSAAGSISFGLWLVCLTGFMALAIYDLRWFMLPDRIVFPLIVLALVYVVVSDAAFIDSWRLALHALAATICLSGLFFLLHTFSRGTWLGFGDVKLAIVLGLLAGDLPHVILLLFGAAVLGTVVSLPLLIQGKATAKTLLPFGPFLLASTFITVLFGTALIQGYFGLFGLR